MSLLDSKPIEQHVMELDEHVQNLIAGSLSGGATIIESLDPEIVGNYLSIIVEPSYHVLGEGIEAERLKQQRGRPVIHWDAKTFRKNYAVNSMYDLSQLPKEPKPIVIIENITDISNEDRNLYDDPELIENVLLHSWKNDTIYLTHPQHGQFQLNRCDYSVVFPILSGTIPKLHHKKLDGIGIMQL